MHSYMWHAWRVTRPTPKSIRSSRTNSCVQLRWRDRVRESPRQQAICLLTESQKDASKNKRTHSSRRMNASGSLRGPKSKVKPEVSTFWCGRKNTTEKDGITQKKRKYAHTHTHTLLTEIMKSVLIYLFILFFSCWRKYCKNPLLYLRDGVHGVFVVGGGVWVDGSSGLSAAPWQSRGFHACQNFSSTSTDLFVAPRDRRRERRWCLWVGPWSPLQRLWVSLPDFLCFFTPPPINVIALRKYVAFLSLSLFVCMCGFTFYFKSDSWILGVRVSTRHGRRQCLFGSVGQHFRTKLCHPSRRPHHNNKADQVSKSDALMFFFPLQKISSLNRMRFHPMLHPPDMGQQRPPALTEYCTLTVNWTREETAPSFI